MMSNYFSEIPSLFIQLVLTTVFSLILGMDQRKHHPHDKEQMTFGTDRTFTFIGLFGFALLVADTTTKMLYVGGGFVLTVLLGIFYAQKIQKQDNYGLTTIILALLTYIIPLIVVTQPRWLAMIYFVIVLLLSGSKGTFGDFSEKIDRSEFITLAKFLVIVGIILPVVPDEQVFSFLNVSPYRIWLAIVVVSGISYMSYLLRKFVFPQAGLLLTGILGGLYSSTATTIIMARKSKETEGHFKHFAAAIIVATAMMFLRVYILLLIFNRVVAILTGWWFLLLILTSLVVAYFLHKGDNEVEAAIVAENLLKDKNPLEFKVAIVFALLYVFFSAVTQFILTDYGQQGLHVLSMVVGFTDIDPFLLNLFQGGYKVSSVLIGLATFQAMASNNLLKLGYGVALGHRQMVKYLVRGFGLILLVNITIIILIHMVG